jgi:hypothetical protein
VPDKSKVNAVRSIYPDGIVSRGEVVDDVGGGLRGPAYFDVAVRRPEHDGIEIQLRVTLIDGAYKVTGLNLSCDGGEVISTEFLRLIPLRTIVRGTVGHALLKENLLEAFGFKDGGNSAAAKLTFVAFTYRLARALGEAPTKAVMEAEGVSRSTASRLVAAARNAGLLRPDEKGQAGGARSRMEE